MSLPFMSVMRVLGTRTDDVPSSIVQIATVTEPAHVTGRAGDYYVPLDQLLARPDT